MTQGDKSEQKELVRLLREAMFTTVFCWRRSVGVWRIAKIAAVGDLPTDFGNAARAAAEDLYANRSKSAYNVEGGLADNEYATLANPRQPPTGLPRIGGNLFQLLDDFGSADVYGKRKRTAAPNLYVVAAQLPNNEQANFGRRISKGNVLARNAGIRTIFDEGTFSKLDGTVISFDVDFDWIEWRERFWILDSTGFNAVFRDVEELRLAVVANVGLITARIRIINGDDFIKRCRASQHMMTKLQKVTDERLYEKPVNMLQDYSRLYPGLGVEWDGDSLVFNGDLDHQWSILRLLDEAAVTGVLSGHQFLAKTKDPL